VPWCPPLLKQGAKRRRLKAGGGLSGKLCETPSRAAV
jgi:hypothetical protein